MAAYKDEARGTWYVSFHYNDWTGKNKRKLKRGFRTRKEALEYEQKFLLQQATNLDMRFEDFYKLYEEDLKPNRYKYAHFTDMIYVSIFKEKAKEYKKILDLKANDKVRDTFYSEILDIIAAYESGLAGAIKHEYERVEHILSIKETETLFA